MLGKSLGALRSPCPPRMDGERQDKSPFPNLPQREVEARSVVRVILIPDGADGLHYFPDGPLGFLSTRPLRFLMRAADGTVLMAGGTSGMWLCRAKS